MKKVLYLFFFCGTILVACNKEDDPIVQPGVCDNTNYTYTSDTKAIFDGSCAFSGCHDPVTKAGGNDLSTYVGVKAAGTGKIIAAIEHTGPVPMPFMQAKLADATIQKIKCWVSKGAPE